MDVITFPVNRKNTSGLQILLHGVISLPDATSYDNYVTSSQISLAANGKTGSDLNAHINRCNI